MAKMTAPLTVSSLLTARSMSSLMQPESASAVRAARAATRAERISRMPRRSARSTGR